MTKRWQRQLGFELSLEVAILFLPCETLILTVGE